MEDDKEWLTDTLPEQQENREIERKFLVPAQPVLLGAKTNKITQGYLAISEDGAEVRIRQKGDHYFETVKTAGKLSRSEFEIEISREQFERLWPATRGRRLRKQRYELHYRGHTIELDLYEGTLNGLMVAEVEFTTEQESEKFTPVHWFGREVTNDPAYKNQNLARYGRPQEPEAVQEKD